LQKISVLGDRRIELPRLLKGLDSIDVFFHDSLHIYEHMVFGFKTAWLKINKGRILSWMIYTRIIL